MTKQTSYTPAPKPKPTPPPARRFSSIARPTFEEAAAKAREAGPRTPVKKTNPERMAKRKARYVLNLRKYKQSECYKAVEARAQGQCERKVSIDGAVVRCPNTRKDGYKLTHNHLSYFGFGGMESPEHVEVLCDPHNAKYETEKRPWNRNRRRT